MLRKWIGLRRGVKNWQDVPVIGSGTLIALHVGLAVVMGLISWRVWTLPT